jgi:sentrin-specific protease 7
MENGKQVRKMPIDIDGQTIWVECVESQKGSSDTIMMDLVDTEGLEMPPSIGPKGPPKAAGLSSSPRPPVGVATGEPPTVDSPDNISSSSTSSALANPNAPVIPKRVPGKVALCKHCGNMSDDHATCSRCRRKLPEDVKVVDDPAFRPKPDSTNEDAAKKSLRAMRIPNKNRRKGNPDEPMCIALSSDEEDNDENSNLPEEDKEEVDIEEEGDESVFEDITAGCPPMNCFSLPCRSVRIGNYKVLPKEKIILSPHGIQIKVPGIINTDDVITITILKADLIKVQAHFGKQMPLLFLYVKESACARARKVLKMSSAQSFFLDVNSLDETQKRITILPEKLTDENKTTLKANYGDTVQDLEAKDANEILVRSSPKEMSSLRGKMGGFNPNMGDKKQNPDTMVTKYCQFPPEGAGNVSVTNEDYACLEVEQFLNDVIIDFYLKFLQFGKFESNAQVREKTHIFTTYFYKRLTTRPTSKNKSRHHPVEDDPNLTAGEKRYDRVRKWTKKVNLFEKDFVVVPINEHAHWFVCVICYPGQLGCVRTEDGAPCEAPLSQSGRLKKKKKKKQITIGSTTIIPLKGRDDLRLNFDDDSDRDEAEASEDDMEDEPEEEDKKKEEEEGAEEVKVGVRQPCILIFDSLAGGSKARTCQTLRDYLTCEWKERMVGQEPRVFNKTNMPGCSPKVQQQPNFSDCGIYLLQYVESFFKSPILDYTLPITSLRSWFPEEEVRGKRANIAELIRNLATTQNPGKEFRYPEILFQGDLEDDMDDDQGETSNHGAVKLSGGAGATMVRLTGGSYTSILTQDKYQLIRKKGNQMRPTLPAGVTVTPTGVTVTPAGPSGVKLGPAAVKIISNVTIPNLQLVNRKMSMVSSSSGEEAAQLQQQQDQLPVQTSPDSTSHGTEQADGLDMEVENGDTVGPGGINGGAVGVNGGAGDHPDSSHLQRQQLSVEQEQEQKKRMEQEQKRRMEDIQQLQPAKRIKPEEQRPLEASSQ